eukprot:COSAG04_NODE_3192_length_3065_cov_21.232558_5_plen_178_part_00
MNQRLGAPISTGRWFIFRYEMGAPGRDGGAPRVIGIPVGMTKITHRSCCFCHPFIIERIWRLYHTLYVEVFGRVHSPLRDLVTKYIVVPEGSSLLKPQVRHFPADSGGRKTCHGQDVEGKLYGALGASTAVPITSLLQLMSARAVGCGQRPRGAMPRSPRGQRRSAETFVEVPVPAA